MRRLCLLVLCLCITLPTFATEDDPNEKAPPETAQFAFIVGDFQCKTRNLTPQGSYVEGQARWNGSWILDGWAIQDEWISVTPQGTFRGINIRSFNPVKGHWECRWLPIGSLQWRHYTAEQVGDAVVMTMVSPERDAQGLYIDRNIFYEITAESWKWRKDRSYDGGKTWNEGISFIEATRVEK